MIKIAWGGMGHQNRQVFSMDAPKGSLEPRHADAVIQGREQQHRPLFARKRMPKHTIEDYLLQNVMKFHELPSVLNSESTTCFTDGRPQGIRRRLPAVSCVSLFISHTRYIIYVFFGDIYKWMLTTT